MKLTSENVNTVFVDCLFNDNEDTTNHIAAEGITCTVGFHPQRLAGHKETVQAMLQCLPDNFQSDKGGGMSFLQACMDKDGLQWGEHRQMEQLFQLGIGLGLAKWQLPREMWAAFPGGMPYVVVDTAQTNNT